MKNPLVEQLTEQLNEFIPAAATPQVVDWMIEHQIQLTISRPRKTKLGDYRPPYGKKGHQISINVDLNPYSFLVTLLHEIAHLFTYNEYKRTVKPHGPEWKWHYAQVMRRFLGKSIFPQDVEKAIRDYMTNPAASSCTDEGLMMALRRHDTNKAEKEALGLVLLSDLPMNHHFCFPNDRRIFRKGPLLRKRYKCRNVFSHGDYTVSAMAEVFPLTGEDLRKIFEKRDK